MSCSWPARRHCRPKVDEVVRLNRILKDDELNGALEYDLKVFLHEDIRGLFTAPQRITWRQVCVWLRHLPGDSALVRRGALQTEWSRQEHFTVSGIDMMKINGSHAWLIAGVQDLPEPEMAQRPGWESDRPFNALAEMIRRVKTMRVVGNA